MTNFYELADDNRADLIFTKDQLLAPLQEGMLPPPFPMAPGMEERDYYQGKVTSATDEQRAYVEEYAAQASSADESLSDDGSEGMTTHDTEEVAR